MPLLLRHNLIGMPTVLVRRSAYEAVGPAFDEHTVYFDYQMWLRLALRFPVGYLAVWDASYRVHDRQVTMTVEAAGGLQELTLLDQIDGLLAKAPHVRPDRRQLRRRRPGPICRPRSTSCRRRTAARRAGIWEMPSAPIRLRRSTRRCPRRSSA